MAKTDQAISQQSMRQAARRPAPDAQAARRRERVDRERRRERLAIVALTALGIRRRLPARCAEPKRRRAGGRQRYLAEEPQVAQDGQTEATFLVRGASHATREYSRANSVLRLRPGDRLMMIPETPRPDSDAASEFSTARRFAAARRSCASRSDSTSWPTSPSTSIRRGRGCDRDGVWHA